jgi:hypothetical protein
MFTCDKIRMINNLLEPLLEEIRMNYRHLHNNIDGIQNNFESIANEIELLKISSTNNYNDKILTYYVILNAIYNNITTMRLNQMRQYADNYSFI